MRSGQLVNRRNYVAAQDGPRRAIPLIMKTLTLTTVSPLALMSLTELKALLASGRK